MVSSSKDRDKLQQQYVDRYIDGKRQGIYLLSVRLGKTRIGIKIMERLRAGNVLIAYPEETVLKAWQKEFDNYCWEPKRIVYSTFLSLHKHIDNYDQVIIDEGHRLSERQRTVIRELKDINPNFLVLTGTMDSTTRDDLLWDCGLEVLEELTTEEAITSDIIANYHIEVVRYEIDTVTRWQKVTKKKSYPTTDRKELNMLTYRVENSSGEAKKWAALSRMRFINTCQSLRKRVRELLSDLDKKRYILYGADTKFIDSLNIPTYHNKSKEDNLSRFLNKDIPHLGLCKLANTSITFPELYIVVVTNIDSNSENLFQRIGRSLVKDDPTKVSKIYIIISTEDFQQQWLNKSLIGIPKDKITYE